MSVRNILRKAALGAFRAFGLTLSRIPPQTVNPSPAGTTTNENPLEIVVTGLQAERDRLNADQYALAAERDLNRAQRDGYKLAYETTQQFQAERDGYKLAYETALQIQTERDLMRAERDGYKLAYDTVRQFEAERDGYKLAYENLQLVQAERDGYKLAYETLQQVQAERDGYKLAYDTMQHIKAERDGYKLAYENVRHFQAERDGYKLAYDDACARLAEYERSAAEQSAALFERVAKHQNLHAPETMHREGGTLRDGFYEPFTTRDEVLSSHTVGERKPICFMQVGKVGGHAISQELLNRFALADTYNGSPEQLDQLSPSELDGKRLIIGHYSYCHTLKLPKKRFLFSMVRNPIDRVVSHYWFLRGFSDGGPGNEMVRLAKTHDFESFIKLENLEARQVVDNYQCTFFASDWRAEERTSDELLRSALSHLNDFDFIGIHEQYDDSMQALAALLGWLPWPSDNRLNVTTERDDVSALTPETLAYLNGRNRLDIELYAEIEKRFHVSRRAILRSLVKMNSIARMPVPKSREDLPARLDLYADMPFWGEGWHTRTVTREGYIRWIGPSSEASVFVTVDRSFGSVLELNLLGWVNFDALRNLSVTANGTPCERISLNIAENTGPGRQRAAVLFLLPVSAEPKVELRLASIDPLPLVEAGFTDDYSRTGSVAVSAIRIVKWQTDAMAPAGAISR